MFVAPLLAAALALAPTFVSAQLGKGSLFGPFDALHMATKSAMDNIPSSGVVSKRSVDVPQICQERVQGYGMNEANTGITCNGLEAMEVQYDDCGEPWTLCRCGDAQIGWDQLIERVGKVPAGSRSYVRGVVATQAPGCSGLCFDGNFIRLHGDCDMFVLMHEVGHAVDDGYPDWPPFVDAINKDSCVPDEYGNTNKVEEFAQMFAMVSGGWFSGNIPADFSCLKNQFDTLWNDWRIQEALGSPTCIQSRKPSINFAPNSAKFGNSFTSSLNKVNVTIPSGLKSLSEAAHFH